MDEEQKRELRARANKALRSLTSHRDAIWNAIESGEYQELQDEVEQMEEAFLIKTATNEKC